MDTKKNEQRDDSITCDEKSNWKWLLFIDGIIGVGVSLERRRKERWKELPTNSVWFEYWRRTVRSINKGDS